MEPAVPTVDAIVLGAACVVHENNGATTGHGTLLEVRRYLRPGETSFVPQHERTGSARFRQPLFAYVRFKDSDNRHSRWVPVEQVEIKVKGALEVSAAFDIAAENQRNATETDGAEKPPGVATAALRPNAWRSDRLNELPDASPQPSHASFPLGALVRYPVLSAVYVEETPGMRRTRHGERQLDFLEERLLRDCRTPTTIRLIHYLNTYSFSPWYYTPFGMFNNDFDAMASDTIRDAFLCPFTLRMLSSAEQLRDNVQSLAGESRVAASSSAEDFTTPARGSCASGPASCNPRWRPPGVEVYRDAQRGLSLFEVNGGKHISYCRHLFLLAKSFLENKLAGHDVHLYYFYVLCLHAKHFPNFIRDKGGGAMFVAGYFSWEKQATDCNLACIVVLPCFHHLQLPNSSVAPHGSSLRGGLGQFLIHASYALAYRRKQIGSPEKPLTDLGEAAYERYWQERIVTWLYKQQRESSAAARARRLDTEQEVAAGSGGSSAAVGKEPGTAAAVEGSRPRTLILGRAMGDHHAGAQLRGASAAKEHAGVGDGADTASSDDGYNLAIALVPAGAHGEAGIDFCVDAVDSSNEPLVWTVEYIAKQVQLEVADVLRTLLRMGFIHKSGETKTLRLLLPAQYIRQTARRIEKQRLQLDRVVFDSACFTPQPGKRKRP